VPAADTLEMADSNASALWYGIQVFI